MFKNLMMMFIKSSIEINIISGPSITHIHKELYNMGIFCGVHYDNIYSVVDYVKYETNEPIEQNEQGRYWCDDTFWWKVKGMICADYNIDVLIDNDAKYNQEGYMPKNTHFIHWIK